MITFAGIKFARSDLDGALWWARQTVTIPLDRWVGRFRGNVFEEMLRL